MSTRVVISILGLAAMAGLEAKTPPPEERNNPSADLTFTQEAPPPSEPLTLWYRRSATKWETEALPVGNGRLAAMVFDGVDRKRIQFNEETVWDGVSRDTNNPQALKALPKVRRLLFEGKNVEATRLAAKTMMGIPSRINSYQTLGDLLLDFPDPDSVAAYRRELNLTTAIARTHYRVDGVGYTREVFVSAPDQVIVIRVEADRPGEVNFTARLQRDDATVTVGSRHRLILRGRLGVRYEAQLLPIVCGGEVTAENGQLTVSGADVVTLLLVGATSYNTPQDISGDAPARCEKALWAAAQKPYARLRAAHIADYQRLFRRVILDLGATKAVRLPTDERLRALKASAEDPQLVALYFQYGRYLLISSSRPGTLPANLQGIWCQHYTAPWSGDYHCNINLR